MRFIDFFAGIGGFRLGMEAAGHECVAHSEIERYACAAYQKRWPGSFNLGLLETIPAGLVAQLNADCFSGGFPCQPFSCAGRKNGSRDQRHLWPVWFRLICAIRPSHLVLENVPGLLTSDDGRTFGKILSDLESAGYDPEWACIPASSLGAAHKRDRLWIVATNPDRIDWRAQSKSSASTAERRRRSRNLVGEASAHPNSYCERQSWIGRTEQPVEPLSFWTNADRLVARGRRAWSVATEGFPIGDDGRPTAAYVRRVAHGVPRRVDRLRCLGNAVVPQVVEWIARRLPA